MRNFGSKNRKSFQLALGILLSVVILSLSARAQQVESMAKFRLAQSFEEAGEWDRALPLYESLYQSEPQNYVYFDALRRACTHLKQYDKAIGLIQQRLLVQQSDFVLRAMLGGLYYLSGREGKADSIWQAIIHSDPKNPNLYRLIVGQMLEYRLYDQAINLYLVGRSSAGNERLFSEELASLYSVIQQYASASREYIKLLGGNPQQLPYVQARMSSYTGREEGLRAALKVIQEEVRRSLKDVGLRGLLAWLYMEAKDYGSALEEYRVIDKLKNAQGVEIFNFAQRALQEHAYRSAAKAFREVIEQYPSPDRLPHVQFGYARAIEELSAESDTSGRNLLSASSDRAASSGGRPEWSVLESRPSYEGAISLYNAIIKDYPKSELAAQAYYRIGVIQYNRFFDLNGALAALEQVRRMSQSLPLMTESLFIIAEIKTVQNNLSGARDEYQSILQNAPSDNRDKATFKLAELDYFEAAFDSCLAKLQRLSSNVATDLANDALQLMYFIQENKGSALTALAQFAEADLMMRQRKYPEALAHFQEIARLYPNALLLDDAMMKIGELHVALNHIQDALTTFWTVANNMQTSILRDRAQMRIGEVYQNMIKDKVKAIEVYEELLAKYPNSIYAEEARRRIRQLRGDAI